MINFIISILNNYYYYMMFLNVSDVPQYDCLHVSVSTYIEKNYRYDTSTKTIKTEYAILLFCCTIF